MDTRQNWRGCGAIQSLCFLTVDWAATTMGCSRPSSLNELHTVVFVTDADKLEVLFVGKVSEGAGLFRSEVGYSKGVAVTVEIKLKRVVGQMVSRIRMALEI